MEKAVALVDEPLVLAAVLESRFTLICLTTCDGFVSEISEQTKRLAGRADYKDRTILNTGANDYICNNYDYFVS
jgi:hypothetical protein